MLSKQVLQVVKMDSLFGLCIIPIVPSLGRVAAAGFFFCGKKFVYDFLRTEEDAKLSSYFF